VGRHGRRKMPAARAVDARCAARVRCHADCAHPPTSTHKPQGPAAARAVRPPGSRADSRAHQSRPPGGSGARRTRRRRCPPHWTAQRSAAGGRAVSGRGARDRGASPPRGTAVDSPPACPRWQRACASSTAARFCGSFACGDPADCSAACDAVGVVTHGRPGSTRRSPQVTIVRHVATPGLHQGCDRHQEDQASGQAS
jgi:hypothetical protein